MFSLDLMICSNIFHNRNVHDSAGVFSKAQHEKKGPWNFVVHTRGYD